MKSTSQSRTEIQLLSLMSLLSYLLSVAALFAFTYSLFTLAIGVAGEEIGSLYFMQGQ